MSGTKAVALVIGAGEHLGSGIAERFAKEGFHIVATRRRGDLGELGARVTAHGVGFTGLHTDARDEDAVKALVEEIETQIGAIEVMIFNAGGNVRFPFLETTTRVYRKVWEMCTLGGFLNARECADRMVQRGRGTIIFTGATASVRGAAGFAAFAGAKHALRATAQSMARELAPHGVHVAHVVIDGAIENKNTRELFPDFFENRPDDAVLQPEELAEIYWNIYRQPRRAWSFETDVRTYAEPW
ncbi:MAG: SDR family NAD(P)-dependent oxidoreductase [Pseudomonadota bacterium]